MSDTYEIHLNILIKSGILFLANTHNRKRYLITQQKDGIRQSTITETYEAALEELKDAVYLDVTDEYIEKYNKQLHENK